MLQKISENQLDPAQQDTWNKAKQAMQSHNAAYAVSLLDNLLKDQAGFLQGRELLRQAQIVALGGQVKSMGMFGGMGLGGLKSKIVKTPEKGLAELESKLANDPGNVKLNTILFEAANEMGDKELAAFALESVKMANPQEKDTLLKLVAHYELHGQTDKASETMNLIAAQFPSDIELGKQAKDLAARASMKATKFGAAGGVNSMVKNQAQTVQLEQQSRMGLSKDQLMAKLQEAITAYNADPNNLDSVKALASTYEQLEDFTNAAAFYQWATQLAPGDVALKDKASKAQGKAQEIELKALKAQLAANPADAALQQQIQELEQAQAVAGLEAATQAVEANPTDAKLRLDLAQSLYASGNASDAIPHLQQAKGNPHIKTQVLLLLAKCFDAKGMLDMGINQLKEASGLIMEMNDTKKEVLYTLGELQLKSGDQAGGIASFKQIYEVDYGYRDVATKVESSYS